MSDATPMSDDDLRLFAQDILDAHTPSKQGLNEYNRCGECNYTRHPCDVYDLAAAVLRLLDMQPAIETVMVDERERLAKLLYVSFDTYRVQSLLDSDADVSHYEAEREAEQ